MSIEAFLMQLILLIALTLHTVFICQDICEEKGRAKLYEQINFIKH